MTKERSRKSTRAKSDSRGSGRVFWLLAFMAALTLGTLAIVTRSEDLDDTVPDELLGRWTTTEPRYADRAFEITRNAVVFYTGRNENDFTANAITSIESTSSERGTLYVVNYLNEDEEYELSFYYQAAAGGVIQFKNQPGMRWKRAERS